LKEADYIEGQNLAIEYPPWAENNYDRFAVLAADLVGRQGPRFDNS